MGFNIWDDIAQLQQQFPGMFTGAASAPASAPLSLPAPAHESTGQKFDALTQSIPYSKGSRRLQGVLLWALGVESGDLDFGEAAFGNMAYAFGYPLNQSEEIECTSLIADGKIIWTLADGWLIDDLGEPDMAIYTGTEEQEPDPEILADKGAARTPAFRGLIYIRFTDMNLAPFGNRMPQMDAVFEPVDALRISVADALVDVGALGGETIVCDGIDAEADGVVFESMDPRDILETYSQIYNYRIIDGDPIRLVSRAVNEDLEIDWDLTSADFVDPSDDDDVVALERVDDSELPNSFIVTYADRSQAYQTRPQEAKLPKFPVEVAASSGVEQVDTDFIISAQEALVLAYAMLWRTRARRLTSPFTLRENFALLEEGDVMSVPTSQGTFIMDVRERSVEPDKSVTLVAEYLLIETTSDLDADAGDLNRSIKTACYYPQMVQQQNTAAGYDERDRIYVSSERIYSFVFCQRWAGIGSASTSIPSRLSSRYVNYHPIDGFRAFTLNADYLIGVANPNTEAYRSETGNISTDDYIYQDWVYLVDRTTMRTVDILKFTDQVPLVGPYRDGNAGIVATATLVFVPGYRMITSPERSRTILSVVDLSAGTATDIDLPMPITTDQHVAESIVLCGVYVLVVMHSRPLGSSISGSRLYRYNIQTEALDYIELAHPLGKGVAAGDSVYFLSHSERYGSPGGFDFSQTNGARVNAASLGITYFDITDDPNVSLIMPGSKPWVSDDNLYFLANNTEPFNDFLDYLPAYVYAPYLAVRSLVDLAVVDGSDLTAHFDSTKWSLVSGGLGIGYHYIAGASRAGNPHRSTGYTSTGCILRLGRDLTRSLFYPSALLAPLNDNFPGTTIPLNLTKKFENEFATKEPGEPNHLGNIGGRSVWYTFVAPSDAVYNAFVGLTGLVGDRRINFVIYEGDDFSSLAQIAGEPVPGSGGADWAYSLNFVGYEGHSYRIVIDGWYGNSLDDDNLSATSWYGPMNLRMTHVSDIPDNNDFANARVLNIGDVDDTDAGFGGNFNLFATKEASEPDHGGDPGGHSTWWKVTVTDPDINALRVVVDADFPALVGIYTGASVGALTEVAAGVSEDTGGTNADWAAWTTAI